VCVWGGADNRGIRKTVGGAEPQVHSIQKEPAIRGDTEHFQMCNINVGFSIKKLHTCVLPTNSVIVEDCGDGKLKIN
jgi:hypothetical protein